MYSLGESVFEHPDRAPYPPCVVIRAPILNWGMPGLGGAGGRGGSGCDPHGIHGGTPRTARGDGMVAATL